MWHPEPGWQPLTSGTGTSTVGVWLAGDRVVKRLGAPLPGDPAELSDPRHVAWWRRPADVAVSRHRRRHPGAAEPGRARGRGGRRRRDGLAAAGAGTPDRRAVRGAVPRPSSPGSTYPIGRGWPATSCGTGCAWSSGAAAGRRWPGPRWRTSPTTSGGAARRTSRRWTRCRRCSSTGTRRPANFHAHDEAGVIALDWATLGTGPVGADLGYWSLERAGGVRAAGRRLPGRPARRPGDAGAGAARGPGHRRLHRAVPGRVGAGPRRRRIRCPGRQVQAPQRGAVPAVAAAAVPADRGAALRGVGFTRYLVKQRLPHEVSRGKRKERVVSDPRMSYAGARRAGGRARPGGRTG